MKKKRRNGHNFRETTGKKWENEWWELVLYIISNSSGLQFWSTWTRPREEVSLSFGIG